MTSKYSSVFGASTDRVGNIGTITDGVYNIPWVIYTISGNTYQLFPMKNLTYYNMNSANTNAGGYEASEMYTYVHNTVLPNLKKSGLNITACDLVSYQVYNDICSKTDKSSKDIAGGNYFWLTDTVVSNTNFYYVDYDGSFKDNDPYSSNFGVRPLITVVKS